MTLAQQSSADNTSVYSQHHTTSCSSTSTTSSDDARSSNNKKEQQQEVLVDLWGYEIRTQSRACIHHINSYYTEVLSYGAEQGAVLKAVEADRECSLALALAAFSVHALNSDTNSADCTAASLVADAKTRLVMATSYEKMVVAGITALIEGKRDVALRAHFEILKHFPRDLVSLKRAQILCFYMGKSKDSLELALMVLPANKEAKYYYGMLAFALLETRKFDDSEVAARKALAIETKDNWAHHALCHVLQYRCRFQEAALFMEKNSESWNTCCSFMYSHNWWHLALVYMEWGCEHALGKVLEIYDGHIWPAHYQDSSTSVQVLLNALGLLLRLQLRGYNDCVRIRTIAVTEQLCDTSWWHKEWLLDLLGLWALSYLGEFSKSISLLNRLKIRVNASDSIEKQKLQMALKLAEGLYEYGRENHQKAFHVLGSSFETGKLKVIGASDEQLDVFEELWCIVCLHSGHPQEASQVLSRRTAEWDKSPFAWTLMEKYHAISGSPDRARDAATRAGHLKSSFLHLMTKHR